MNIHEYQAKALLSNFGVPVPKGAVALSKAEVKGAAGKVEGPVWVVKAQIHAGGRGKGGGVKVVDSRAKAEQAAEAMLGMQLVTPQTGAQGKKVRRVYFEQGLNIARELYLGILTDRENGCVAVIASSEGGMDIEEVAARTPNKIIRVGIDAALGLQEFHVRKLAFGLGLNKGKKEGEKDKRGKSRGAQVRAFGELLGALYRAFGELDASLLEINPLVVTKEGGLAVLDAKMNFDGNALFRQPRVRELRDLSEEDATEVEADAHGLNYIKLDGEIGCLVNGAGLAMATMDIIKLYGGAPANFLDVGGGASAERVTEACKIILKDANVKAILVNIFGGIMRCDVIAEGLVAAAKEVRLKVPLVVRLEGTEVKRGKAILADSGLPILTAENLAEAAEKAVQAAGK